jgi:hypothetical protein
MDFNCESDYNLNALEYYNNNASHLRTKIVIYPIMNPYQNWVSLASGL